MERQCSRPGCREPAEATLSYHYGQRTVWVQALSSERHPSSYDLCERHAAVGVPVGWDLEDLRPHAGAPFGRPTSLAG